MYKLIASILVILAILLAWYLTQGSSSTPKHGPDDGGIKFNSVTFTGEMK